MISSIRLLAVASLLILPSSLQAQGPGSRTKPADEQLLNSKGLDALVAPIALFPDALLAQMLMASTYPLEVVSAERWLKKHSKLQGDRLKRELAKQPWDDSVKSLVATPSVLPMMSSRLEWTQKLGDAVLAQQPDVMDAIQRLRSRAYANENLKTTKEQKVTVTQDGDGNRKNVAIEPAEAGTIYVPYYDPAVVYGEWPYPDYPPYPYYLDEAYFPGAIVGTGVAFGAGYALWRWGSGRFWGGHINWGKDRIDINRGAHVEHWRHNPHHRRGVGYNNADVRQRFAGDAKRPGQKGQLDFRGRGGQQILKPGTDRPKVGDKRPANRAKTVAKGRSNQSATQRRSQVSRSPHQRAAHPRSSRGVSRNQRRAPARAGQSARPTYGYRAIRGSHRAAGRGGGGFRGGRGGRRSDIALKENMILLGYLRNGLGFYRFEYRDSPKTFVGVVAQEVQAVMPEAVVRGQDGYLRVYYDKLGLKFQTYREWVASGAQLGGRERREAK